MKTTFREFWEYYTLIEESSEEDIYKEHMADPHWKGMPIDHLHAETHNMFKRHGFELEDKDKEGWHYYAREYGAGSPSDQVRGSVDKLGYIKKGISNHFVHPNGGVLYNWNNRTWLFHKNSHEVL